MSRALLAALLVSCAAAGCGGRSPAHTTSVSSTASSDFTNGLRFAKCMRADGVPHFPDPRDPGGFSSGALAALNPSSPAFTSATTRCDRLLPNNGQMTQAEIEQAVGKGLSLARCMRAHRVDFPDPEISGSHITIDFSNINSNAPQYIRAFHICTKAT